MDATLLAYLVGLAGITITPLAGFGVNLLLKKANESVKKADEAKQKAELAKMGIQGSVLDIGIKNSKIAIFATQQAFKNKPDAINEEKKEFGMGMFRQLNDEAKINMSEETMSALIDGGVWQKNNPVPIVQAAPEITSGTTVTNSTSTFTPATPVVNPTFDKTLLPKGDG
jgi:hypothetical protein